MIAFTVIAILATLGLPLVVVTAVRQHDNDVTYVKPSKEAQRVEAMANHPAGKGL